MTGKGDQSEGCQDQVISKATHCKLSELGGRAVKIQIRIQIQQGHTLQIIRIEWVGGQNTNTNTNTSQNTKWSFGHVKEESAN